tara:strand:- start:2514 stop:4499 length:1986 start_codon:yes stop_codon:yes gene_type:complete
MSYKEKYLKYKLKYLLLKQQEQYVFTGGMEAAEAEGEEGPLKKKERTVEIIDEELTQYKNELITATKTKEESTNTKNSIDKLFSEHIELQELIQLKDVNILLGKENYLIQQAVIAVEQTEVVKELIKAEKEAVLVESKKQEEGVEEMKEALINSLMLDAEEKIKNVQKILEEVKETQLITTQALDLIEYQIADNKTLSILKKPKEELSPGKTPPRSSGELPDAPKKERPDMLSEIDAKLEDTFHLIEQLKVTEGSSEIVSFELLFDQIFQLNERENDNSMILNLLLFVKDLEHDYNYYLKDEKIADDDRINILIGKCISKLDEKIKLEAYDFTVDMLNDDMLRQGTAVKEGLIMPTYVSLLLRGILEEDFHFISEENFLKPEEEFESSNILQDQGYNPAGLPANKINRIELDGLIEVEEGKLLETDLDKKDIYSLITQKWLEYIFTSLCRLELLYLRGKELYVMQDIFSSIMINIEFIVTIREGKWYLKIKYKKEDKVWEISNLGKTKDVFKFVTELDIMEFCKGIIKVELQSEEKIYKILWTRLRDIFKLLFAFLKTLGDKAYEFLIIIFIMKYIKKPDTKFLIETKDNHLINSLFTNIIPLIKLLKNKGTYAFNLGIRFPVKEESLLEKTGLLKTDKTILFTHNQVFSSPELSLELPLE